MVIAALLRLYAGVGVTMFKGGTFLAYNALDPAHPTHGQHVGILLVELGVGLTVTAVMCAIFFAFAERGNAHEHRRRIVQLLGGRHLDGVRVSIP